MRWISVLIREDPSDWSSFLAFFSFHLSDLVTEDSSTTVSCRFSIAPLLGQIYTKGLKSSKWARPIIFINCGGSDLLSILGLIPRLLSQTLIVAGPKSLKANFLSLFFIDPSAGLCPRSSVSSESNLSLVYLSLCFSSFGRGLLSRGIFAMIQGLVDLVLMVGKSQRLVNSIATLSCSEHRVQHLYQILVLLKSPSTPLFSSDLSNSLLERGICLLESIPKKSFNFLTALLSCVMVYMGPEDATVLILMRTEVLKSSKSHYAVNAVTTPQLAIDLVWRFGFLMNFKPSNILVDKLSNYYQFVYLSSCKFDLFASALAIWPANWVISGLAYLCVIF